MADLSRRGFLAQMSVTTGVGIAGGLGLHKLLEQPNSPAPTADPPASPAVQLPLDGVTVAGPMVLHIRDIPTAEISMMVGTQELVYRDPELVARLVSTAMSATQREA